MDKRLPSSVQIGAAIRKIREAREPDLTIEALAQAADIDTSYLSDIERLLRNPSWEIVAALVEALDIDLMELVDEALRMPADASPEADKPVV